MYELLLRIYPTVTRRGRRLCIEKKKPHCYEKKIYTYGGKKEDFKGGEIYWFKFQGWIWFRHA
uniref:Uncharacterized protein n=1 Tax=Helianthus annuus TaxID=4232 RepID=A0A251SG93_HELAN